jgi:hypothetical protein
MKESFINGRIGGGSLNDSIKNKDFYSVNYEALNLNAWIVYNGFRFFVESNVSKEILEDHLKGLLTKKLLSFLFFKKIAKSLSLTLFIPPRDLRESNDYSIFSYGKKIASFNTKKLRNENTTATQEIKKLLVFIIQSILEEKRNEI